MSNNYKKRIAAQTAQSKEQKKFEKKFHDTKSSRVKNIMAYVLAFLMILWTIASVLGVIAFGRTNEKPNTIVASAASAPDDDNYDDSFPNSTFAGRLGDYANYMGFPYSFLPDNFDDVSNNRYTFNGLTVSLNNGGTLTFNGVSTTQFEFVLCHRDDNQFNLVSGQSYYFYIGNNTVLPLSDLVICYINNGAPVYHSMYYGPLVWSSNYSLRHIFIRMQPGTSFDNVILYPSLLRGTTAQLNALDKNAGSKYYTMPLQYGYYYGFNAGVDSGYESGFEDALQRIKSSFFINSSLYIRPSQSYGSFDFVEYSFNYIDKGIDIRSGLLAANTYFTNNVTGYSGALEIAFVLYEPINANILADSLTFNQFTNVGGFLRFYDRSFANTTGSLPNSRYSGIFSNGSYTFINNVIDVPIYYFVLSVTFADFNSTYRVTDRNSVTNNAYQYGYDKGYESGFNKGKLDNTVYDDGYKTGYAIGYDKGVMEADNNPYTFTKLFSAVLDVPVRVFTSLFDFNVLGVNLSAFFFSLLSVCFVLVVIKLLL